MLPKNLKQLNVWIVGHFDEEGEKNCKYGQFLPKLVNIHFIMSKKSKTKYEKYTHPCLFFFSCLLYVLAHSEAELLSAVLK